MAAAHSLIGETNALLSKPNHMKPSLIEAGARLFVTRFLGTYISAGCLILLEEGDTILTFEGDKRKCSMKIVLKVHTPQFYWKIMTRADLGLADAYIDGDISFTDENEDSYCRQRVKVLYLKIESEKGCIPTARLCWKLG
ncbi:uncharacterized protein LOC112038565 isoform X2 [Quercus suber]|uniref:uncharacterized protein LOC112038565 isoform X2 n=1 Tax=Quercus suber TaxID=58331 RepID=UPI0032DFB757